MLNIFVTYEGRVENWFRNNIDAKKKYKFSISNTPLICIIVQTSHVYWSHSSNWYGIPELACVSFPYFFYIGACLIVYPRYWTLCSTTILMSILVNRLAFMEFMEQMATTICFICVQQSHHRNHRMQLFTQFFYM